MIIKLKLGGPNGKGDPIYTVHMNVRLTPEQAAAVRASGLKDSECIREAVQQWIDNGGIIYTRTVLQ